MNSAMRRRHKRGAQSDRLGCTESSTRLAKLVRAGRFSADADTDSRCGFAYGRWRKQTAVEAASNSAARKGKNEAIFREANESLVEKAQRLIDPRDVERLPFLCECPRLGCTKVALLSLSEYETIRAHGWGLAVVGHEDLSVERIVARDERFLTTEKFGLAGQVFAETDPRRG